MQPSHVITEALQCMKTIKIDIKFCRTALNGNRHLLCLYNSYSSLYQTFIYDRFSCPLIIPGCQHKDKSTRCSRRNDTLQHEE